MTQPKPPREFPSGLEMLMKALETIEQQMEEVKQCFEEARDFSVPACVRRDNVMSELLWARDQLNAAIKHRLEEDSKNLPQQAKD